MPTLKPFIPSILLDKSNTPMAVHPLTIVFTGDCSELEQPFIEDFIRNSLLQIRITLIISLCFYALFGVLDAILAPEIKHRVWTIRFGVVCPVILLTFICSYFEIFIKRMHALLMATSLIAGSGIVYMTVIGNAYMASTYYAGLMLILMFIYGCVWERFVWATLCGWSLVVAYIVAATSLARLPPEILVNNAFFCMTANLIGMVVCYTFEFYSTTRFLHAPLIEGPAAGIGNRQSRAGGTRRRAHAHVGANQRRIAPPGRGATAAFQSR